jgi:hypothetical protein
MGTVYKRGDKLYLGFKDATDKRRTSCSRTSSASACRKTRRSFRYAGL